MIHPTALHEMARSAHRDMDRDARAAGLARAYSRSRGEHHSRARRISTLVFASVVLAGAVLLV